MEFQPKIQSVLSLTMLLGLLAVSNAFVKAENAGNHDDYASHKTQQMTQQLGLSPDQAAQIQSILGNNIHSTIDQTPEQRRQQWQQTQTQISSILTDQQRQQYQQIQAQRESRRQENRSEQMGNWQSGGGRKHHRHHQDQNEQDGTSSQDSGAVLSSNAVNQ